MAKVWFITGCSSGFGHHVAKKLLERAEKVVVTARNLTALDDLRSQYGQAKNALFLSLDVTKEADILNAVNAANAHFGRIDVLINNAGYGLVGALEECDMSSIHTLFNTNVFGLMQLTKKILPLMRAQKAGHIINLSSIAGLVSTAGFGIYNASKFAVEGLSEALALEVKHLGIAVTLIEPGPFRTDFAGRSVQLMPEITDYSPSMAASRKYIQDTNGTQTGDPDKAADIIIKTGLNPNPPLRILLGSVAVTRFEKKLGELQQLLMDGAALAKSADFTGN